MAALKETMSSERAEAKTLFRAKRTSNGKVFGRPVAEAPYSLDRIGKAVRLFHTSSDELVKNDSANYLLKNTMRKLLRNKYYETLVTRYGFEEIKSFQITQEEAYQELDIALFDSLCSFDYVKVLAKDPEIDDEGLGKLFMKYSNLCQEGTLKGYIVNRAGVSPYHTSTLMWLKKRNIDLYEGSIMDLQKKVSETYNAEYELTVKECKKEGKKPPKYKKGRFSEITLASTREYFTTRPYETAPLYEADKEPSFTEEAPTAEDIVYKEACRERVDEALSKLSILDRFLIQNMVMAPEVKAEEPKKKERSVYGTHMPRSKKPYLKVGKSKLSSCEMVILLNDPERPEWREMFKDCLPKGRGKAVKKVSKVYIEAELNSAISFLKEELKDLLPEYDEKEASIKPVTEPEKVSEPVAPVKPKKAEKAAEPEKTANNDSVSASFGCDSEDMFSFEQEVNFLWDLE